MSAFYPGDVVEFREDPAISGVIDTTWSNVETEPNCVDIHVFIHTSMPSHVREVWRKQARLLPGYVIVQFLLPQDGFGVVAESSLHLRDRDLTLGDIVKRRPSDHQSGRVLSTSAECNLEPVCSIEEYAATRPIIAQGHQPTHGPYPKAPGLTKPELHGFPFNDQAKALSSNGNLDTLTVPAREVVRFEEYREGDYVIYKDWIGRVRSVLDEITVRLTNGSVVVVENPDELETSAYFPGTSSYELVQRLDRAGYYRYCCGFTEMTEHTKVRTEHVDFFYPGLQVRTKKGNLRRGIWKFGDYDPDVEPQGIVVEARNIELEVEWLFPNLLDRDTTPGLEPRSILDVDILQRREIRILNEGHIPQHPHAKTLHTATYGTDTEHGTQVRFRDSVGAAVKYAPRFKRIARIDTQGYDMNVLHITSTRTKVLVQWQDGSLSEETSVSLIPTQNLDENDVWPGDKVSLKADETTTGTAVPKHWEIAAQEMDQSGNAVLNARTIGVVQTVNATERLAKVRWFKDASFKLELDGNNRQHRALPSSTYGLISNDISEVSLYDIAPYDALYPRLGDLALACPAPAVSHPQLADYFGEVVELCLDGEVVIRCYAASEPRDFKVAVSNLIMVATADYDGDEDGNDDFLDEAQEDEDLSEETSASDGELYNWSDDMSPEPIDIQIEYEGGENMDIDGEDDAWSTDNDIPTFSSPSDPQSSLNDVLIDPALREAKNTTTNAGEARGDTQWDAKEKPGAPSTYHLAPFPFLILEEAPPIDHHYSSAHAMAATNIAKKARKEHKIMQSSLPDGVFVRTWESRLDLLRVLIVGPVGTPFEHAPFFFDLHFATPFPDEAPKVFFHSWTNNLGRINPNLYENGKVCLSLLGTWPADERNEGWSNKSTVLQILVSILGLILVKEPYYNEAGFEVLAGSEESHVASRMYSEKAFVMAKGFVKAALSNPPGGLLDVIDWLYRAQHGPRLLNRIIKECRKLSGGPSKTSSGEFPEVNTGLYNKGPSMREESWAASTERLSAGALVPLNRHVKWLVEYNNKENHETIAATLEPAFEGKTDQVN